MSAYHPMCPSLGGCKTTEACDIAGCRFLGPRHSSTDTRITTLEAEVARKDGEIARLTKDRDQWKGQHELYVHAWFRALDHRLIHKRHQIDALALTTQTHREKAALWDAYQRATATERTPGAIEYASWAALTQQEPGRG